MRPSRTLLSRLDRRRAEYDNYVALLIYKNIINGELFTGRR